MRRVKSNFVIKVSAALLALAAAGPGCAHYQARPISAADNGARIDDRRLDDPGLRRLLESVPGATPATWPLQVWDFPRLTLAAFYFQPALEVARAEWASARAAVMTAGARPNPTLNVTPGYDFSASGGLSPWIPLFSVDVPLETAGKRGYRIARAEALSQSARLNIAAVAWQTRGAVRASVLQLAAAERRATLLEQAAQIQRQIVRLLEGRVAAGAIARPEVIPARILLEKSLIDLADAQRARAEARAGVAEAIGIPLRALDGLTLASDFFQAPPAANELTSAALRRDALRHRADVLAALADYAGAESALRLEIARQYPDIHFAPGYQFDQGDNKWSLGLTVELPVLNQNQGPIAEALAHRSEAAARFNALQARVIAAIDRAATGYRAAQEQLAGLEALATAQRKQADSAQALAQAGAGDRLDLLGAQLELATGEIARLDALVKAQSAYGALEDAIQRPLDLPAAARAARIEISADGATPPPR